MRKGLDRAVGAYNKAVGSLERSVLPSARRLRTLGAGAGEEIGSVEHIDHQTRQVSSADLSLLPGDEDEPPTPPRAVQTEM
jgi:DNA recombination protein RmuC